MEHSSTQLVTIEIYIEPLKKIKISKFQRTDSFVQFEHL